MTSHATAAVAGAAGAFGAAACGAGVCAKAIVPSSAAHPSAVAAIIRVFMAFLLACLLSRGGFNQAAAGMILFGECTLCFRLRKGSPGVSPEHALAIGFQAIFARSRESGARQHR